MPTKPNLFVVKEAAQVVSAPIRMVSAEQLQADQRRSVEEIVARLRLPGVVIGALVTNAAWDIRPLLLQDGVVSLVRLSDPKCALQSTILANLNRLHQKLAELPLGNCLLSHGQAEGQVWVRRRYFQRTLAEGALEWLPFHPLQFVQRLIRSVQALHRAEVIHGHIAPSNLSFDERGPVLFDHGFYHLGGSHPLDPSSIVPELAQKKLLSVAADVFGLGLILRDALASELGPKELALIDQMLSSDPTARPALNLVADVFIPSEQRASLPVTPVQPAHGSLSAGKLLGGAATKAPTPAPIKNPVVAPPLPSHAPVVAPKILNPVLRTDQPISLVGPERTSDSVETQVAGGAATPDVRRNSSLFWPAAVLALLAAGGVLHRFGVFNTEQAQQQAQSLPYANYWTSNQPSKMSVVAAAALNKDAEAQLVIIGDAMRGSARPMVRSTLLRSAFNPLWERGLTDGDREIILRLALSKLLPEAPFRLPPLRDAHPAVVFALAGDIPDLQEEQGSREFADVSLSRMAELPKPYGMLFVQLGELGVQTMAELPARALSHLLAGDASALSFEGFFRPTDSRIVALAKVAMLLPLMERAPGLAEAAYASLLNRMNPLLEQLQWFSLEELADWSKLSKTAWFALMVGADPQETLTVQQWADLLLFPDKRVRDKAQQRLVRGHFSPSAASMLEFLSSPENKLSRFQTISMLSAFKSEGEVGYSLLANVLSAQPDPRSILKILLSRSQLGKADPFSLDLSRYLSRSRWDASLQELKQLVGHPERHTRVLAYSRLDPSKPEHLAILQNAVVVEPHESTRRQLEIKLEPFQEQAATEAE